MKSSVKTGVEYLIAHKDNPITEFDSYLKQMITQALQLTAQKEAEEIFKEIESKFEIGKVTGIGSMRLFKLRIFDGDWEKLKQKRIKW